MNNEESLSSSNNSNTESSGGLLNYVKSAASSVLGLGDKDKLNDPIDLNEAAKVEKSSEKGSLKDKILSKADELLEHNPSVEKTDKVNIQADKGLETTTAHTKNVQNPEDLDEFDVANESETVEGGLTGKVTNLVSSAVHTAVNTATFISEKTLGHETTENIKSKASDLLETVENKLGIHSTEDITGPAKARLNAIKTKSKEKLVEAKVAGKEFVNELNESHPDSSFDNVELPEVSDHPHKQLARSAARRLKAHKAKLAKKAAALEEKVEEKAEAAKEQLHELKSNMKGGKNKNLDEKVDNKTQMEA